MADPPAYTTLEQVRRALQERSLDAPAGNSGDGPLGEDIVGDAIRAASSWFRRTTRTHVFDPDADTSLAVHLPTEPATAATVARDLPSSSYRQDGQLFQGGRRTATSGRDTEYPVTTAGPYARVRLPHTSVQSLTALNVRDRDGGVTDWTGDPAFEEGRGEDYYVRTDGSLETRPSHLFIRAAAVGSRTDFTDLLELDYEYGLDLSDPDTDAGDIQRGIACLAAATVVADDNVLTALPENATLIGADTEVQQLIDQAVGDRGYLTPYMEAPVR